MKRRYLFILIALLIIGSIWQAVMQKNEMKQYKPVGEIISVNSHKMHLYQLGNGEATIVFIEGSGTPCAYTDFYALQNGLQKDVKTVSFDHAGFGWSEATDIPRTIDNLVYELHELLGKANLSAPFIFVGHSLASLEAIRYAQQYPEEVKGIILLDGGSPEFYAETSEFNSILLNRTNAVLRVTGINRFIGNFGVMLPFVGEKLRYRLLPKEIKSIDAAMYYNNLGNGHNLDLISRINENAKTVIENGFLKDIPLLALSSDTGEEWEAVQKELLHWSNISNQKTIEGGKHYIHWSSKTEVLAELKQFIKDN